MYRGALVILLVASFARAEAVRRYSPADAVRLAAAHVATLPEARQPYARYVSLHAVPEADREVALRTLAFVVNSWNTHTADVWLPPAVGPDNVVAWIDLETLHVAPAAWDDLGVKGSGGAPFPDPWFHLVVVQESRALEDYGYYSTDSYGRRVWVTTEQRPTGKLTRKERVAQGNWLPKQELTALLLALKDGDRQYQAPLLEYYWLIGNGTIEPRYHELLGLGEDAKALEKLADADEKAADRLGAQTRGAVTRSEVGARNRALERTPTRVRFGRGAFHQSLDFKTSLRQQDVVADLLAAQPDANEVLWTLPNGLLGYQLFAKGKRIDFADPEIAQDARTPLKDKLVWSGRNCMGCHHAERGFVLVDCEARAMAKGLVGNDVVLLADRLAGGDKQRSRRIRDKYFTVDFNELLEQDRVFYTTAVAAATRLARDPTGPGMTCEESAAALADDLVRYFDRPVTLKSLAREVGVAEATLRGVLERAKGIDHTLVGLLLGRAQRRDQIEASLGQLLGLLSVLPAR